MHDLQESYCKGTVFKKCVIWYMILLLEKHKSYCINKKNKVCHKAYSFLSECLSIIQNLC